MEFLLKIGNIYKIITGSVIMYAFVLFFIKELEDRKSRNK
ncbi:hypothetical protein SAMN02745112_00433 [Clostridium tetani]|nr:hypothetical protein SAMN02745112_00433 [Clostridium tetani]